MEFGLDLDKKGIISVINAVFGVILNGRGGEKGQHLYNVSNIYKVISLTNPPPQDHHHNLIAWISSKSSNCGCCLSVNYELTPLLTIDWFPFTARLLAIILLWK